MSVGFGKALKRAVNVRRVLWVLFALAFAMGCSGGGPADESTGSAEQALSCGSPVLSASAPNGQKVRSSPIAGTAMLPYSITFSGPIAIGSWQSYVAINVTTPTGVCGYNYTQPYAGSTILVYNPSGYTETTAPSCPSEYSVIYTAPITGSFSIEVVAIAGALTVHGTLSTVLDDSNACTADSCNANGMSQHSAQPGTSCPDDGNRCNGSEICTASLDSVGNTSATCGHSGNLASGASCSDGLICNGAETCNGSGTCVAGTQAPYLSSCSDSNPCNGVEYCDEGGVCAPGTAPASPYTSPDGCTTYSCVSGLGFQVSSSLNTSKCTASNQSTTFPTDSTVPTNFGTSTSFIYGASGWQTGLAASISAVQAGVIRGRVLDIDGATPLAGVSVSLLNYGSGSSTNYGQATTHLDGYFDMVVNAGGTFVVDYQLAGRLESQRTITTRWNDYAIVDDVILVPKDSNPSPPTVTYNSPTVFQVATFPSVTDSSGTRTPRLFFPPNTTANFVPTGNKFTLRSVEYTSGPNGPKMMPGTLPPQSAYTYAVDFSADETPAGQQLKFSNANGSNATYNNTVYLYLDNFLSMPIGFNNGTATVPTTVPAGYYDPTRGQWSPQTVLSGSPPVPSATLNGVVLTIVSITGSPAQANVNISGTKSGGSYVADPFVTLQTVGITTAELQSLATVSAYTAGKQLWRVPMQHFSGWDLNWGYAFPDGAVPPPFLPPSAPIPPDDPCIAPGSIIECQSQILAEQIPIFGTPYSLRYQSDRVQGRAIKITVPLIGSSQPPSVLSRIEALIDVAGRHQLLTVTRNGTGNFDASATWDWDRLDAYGRRTTGIVPAHIRVLYVYAGVPESAEPASFGGFPLGALSGIENVAARELDLERDYEIDVGVMDAENLGFGGWSLSAEHVYDSNAGILYRGDGARQTQKALPPLVQTVAGGGTGGDGSLATKAYLTKPFSIAVGADNSLYIGDVNTYVIRKVDGVSGLISTIAGTGMETGTFTPGPALGAIVHPIGMSIGPDGNLYVADDINNRILKITLPASPGVPQASLVAGQATGASSISNGGNVNDGGPATSAYLYMPASVVVAKDGSVYIADTVDQRVRRVSPEGTISTVAGNGTTNTCSGPTGACTTDFDGIATDVGIVTPYGLDIDRDGSLLIASYGANSNNGFRVRRLTMDGRTTTIIGNGSAPGLFSQIGDGGPALAASTQPTDVHVGPDGALYIDNYVYNVIQRIDVGGSIATFAGNGVANSSPTDGIPATSTNLTNPYRFAFGPDGAMYIADQAAGRIRRVFADGSRSSGAVYTVSKSDGSEVYEFDGSGRHLSTVSSLRGQARQTLTYDTTVGQLNSGKLLSIQDGDGNTTTIDRSHTGQITITGPNGLSKTVILFDTYGYISAVQNPQATEVYHIAHSPTGLLQTFQTPYQLSLGSSVRSTFSYGPDGLLTSDVDALAGVTGQTLSQTLGVNGWSVLLTTAQGRVKNFGMDFSVLPSTPPTGASPSATRNQYRSYVSPAGLTNTDMRFTDGTRVLTLADGTQTAVQLSPDPRFGMSAPYASARTVQKGTGHQYKETMSKSVSLSTATDLFSVSSASTTDTVNGLTTATAFTAPTETTTLPSGRQISRTLDSKDRVVGVSVLGSSPSTLSPISIAYTTAAPFGRIDHVTQGSRTYQLTYDATKQYLSSVQDVALGLTVSYSNPDGDLRSQTVTLPGSRNVGKAFDLDGNLSSLTTPNANLHKLIANAVGLLGTYYSPASSTTVDTTYGYDFDHWLASVVDLDGTRNYYRDAEGRTTAVGPVTRTYSATTGLLAKESTLAGDARTYNYTAADGPLVTSITLAGSTGSHTLALQYDNFFRVVGRNLDSIGNVAFGYDIDGLLVTAGAETITRGPLSSSGNGLVAKAVLGSLTETPTFDSYGALSGDVYGSSSVYSLSYARDVGGRVTQKTEIVSGTTTTTTYVYDGNAACTTGAPNDGRLCKATIGSTNYGPYTYDADGNRTDLSGYSYDSEDRVSAPNASYTGGGRLTTKTVGTQTATYNYDLFGNLTHVGGVAGTSSIIDYVIDARNHRIGKKVNGTLVQGFLYDDRGRLAAELNGSGAVVSQFVYGTKQYVPDYMTNGGNTYRLLTDQLGSVRMVVNVATNAVAQTVNYDPWGKITSETNSSNGNASVHAFQPFGFAGGLHDRDAGGDFTGDGGWVRFGARDYDTNTGRWTTKDAARFFGGLNLYVYTNDDPVNFIDPSGRSALSAAAGWAASAAEGVGTAVVAGPATFLAAMFGLGYSTLLLPHPALLSSPTAPADGSSVPATTAPVCGNSAGPPEPCDNVGDTGPIGPYECLYRCADGHEFRVQKNVHSDNGCDPKEDRDNEGYIQM